MDGQSRSQKTPEEIRAERIAATVDPRVRQDLDAIAKERDAKLALEREKQRQTYDNRVEELRALKMKSANAPQLAPRGMRSPYLGKDGHERATIDAKAQIQTQDYNYLKNVAKEYNDQIDKRLDAGRENQAARTVIPMNPVREPNRYAKLIEQQNYAERAQQAQAERQKQMDQAQQQQRQRGLQR